jgi:hypothetical protein
MKEDIIGYFEENEAFHRAMFFTREELVDT